jgi:hypothetical protein
VPVASAMRWKSSLWRSILSKKPIFSLRYSLHLQRYRGMRADTLI